MLRRMLPLSLVLAAAPAVAAGPDAGMLNAMQTQFAAAYNRGDLDAMAAAFTEDALRVTPSGIFQGRDAIRGSFAAALKLGLRDYTVHRLISRPQGDAMLDAGNWSAKLGDQSFNGYYTAIVVRDGGTAKIVEETVTVAAP